MPDFTFENQCGEFSCGLDEVGRAPLAGPVVAACVHIPADRRRKHVWRYVDDSKKMTRKDREAIYDDIRENSFFGIGEAGPREIEELNIAQASLLAMKRAYDQMCASFDIRVERALIDGRCKIDLGCPSEPVIGGDSKSISIAAASILAKVFRDRFMIKLAEQHPHYAWESNVGYGTRDHLEGINRHGVTEHHRKTFSAVRNYIEYGQTRRQLKFRV